MIDVVDSLQTEIETTILATFPELATTVILDENQAKRRNFTGIPFPFCILQIGAGSEGEWGIGNLAMERPAKVHYVMEWSDDAQRIVRGKIGRLKHRLAQADYSESGATWLPGRTEDDTTPDSELNRILVEKNLQAYGGTLVCWYTAGETVGSVF